MNRQPDQSNPPSTFFHPELSAERESPGRLNHFFEASAQRTPDAIAVVADGQPVTYRDLDCRANHLARELQEQGIRPGDRVGLLMERSVEAYQALLAILKAGAVFVPLDRSFPTDRLAFMVTDAQLTRVITSQSLVDLAHRLPCPFLVPTPLAHSDRIEPPIQLPDTAEICYILYTSGTTSNPKGVPITHASICNFISICTPLYGYRPSDRVYQGMTLAFDFSFEEIWPTFAVGAILVPGPLDHRRFGSGLNQFLMEQKVTVLCCVPTLLATLEKDIPQLRLLMVGGEACPGELVKRWSQPGRRILNTYGPTETTVTATWAELLPDKPVTIGRPLPTVCLHLLDENLQPVEEGRTGEICIGGPGVAEGYLNQPHLTADRFVPDPICGPNHRLYRTGDLGRWTADGEMEYLGRIDTQVKIRGHRVELGEIEAILLSHFAIASAVVHLDPRRIPGGELVAYIVTRESGDRTTLRQELHQELQKRLPPYMVPAYLEELNELPTLASGKVDRSRLPAPVGLPLIGGRGGREPETDLEKELAAVWSAVLGFDVIQADADFFIDFGGHSLLAAQVVSRLREDDRFRDLGLADLYRHPSITALAMYLHSKKFNHRIAGEESAIPAVIHHSDGQVLIAGLIQMTFLYVSLIPQLLPTVALVWVYTASGWEILEIVQATVVIGLAIPLVVLLLPIVAKWLLLGQVEPGEYPLWGWFFCRWWLARKLYQSVPVDYLAGSPLLAWYLRLLGAKIGKGCYLGSAELDTPDLITLGDQVSLGYDASLEPAHIAGGMLRLVPISIDDHAFIGTNSLVSGNTTIAKNGRLLEQSHLNSGQQIPMDETWTGSPARVTQPDPQLETLSTEPQAGGVSLLWWMGYALTSYGLQLLPLLLSVPGLYLIWTYHQGSIWTGLLLTPVAAIIFVLGTLLVIIAGKWLVLPDLQPGIYPQNSLFALQKWIGDRLMQMSLDQVNTLYSTLYLSPFLRLLGVRVGPRAEVSTVAHMDPDLLTLGEECFVADLAVIGAARYYQGLIALGETVVGTRAFVGNAALVRGEIRLPADSLIGVLSVAPNLDLPAGSSWLGSPPIFLPRRQSSGHFDESVTYRPGWGMVICRLLIELGRVLLPSTLGYAGLFLLAFCLGKLLNNQGILRTIALAPLFYLGTGCLLTLVVVLLKWLIVGRYRPRVEPQWSHFVWRTELITGLYESVAVPWLLNWLAGTPAMAPLLRLFGATVGDRVYLDSSYLTEFDLVHIGDDVAVAGQSSLQTHLFEDRVMKMSNVTIQDGCSIGSRAVVLYDSNLEAGTTLDALSLVMKGETLPQHTKWTGIPAVTQKGNL